MIDGFWVSNGSVKINERDSFQPTLIEHQSDLVAMFPEFDFDGPIPPPTNTSVLSASNPQKKNKKKKKKK